LEADADDQCGYAVSLSGDVLLVGAPQDEDAGLWYGSAYVLRFNGATWAQEQKLFASEPTPLGFFGTSVTVDGNVAIVGAHNAGGVGAAYVSRFNTIEWVFEDKLAASDAASDDQFGMSVSVSGIVALVGAHHNDHSADPDDNSGAAYVFRFNSETSLWDQEAKLTASDAGPGDGFGFAVSLRDNVALIGANNDITSDSGSAYVFRHNGVDWVEEDKLTAPSSALPGDDFGASVSISGDLAVVGARGDDSGGDGAGAAYLFRYDGDNWALQAVFTASDADLYDSFGWSVAVAGGTTFVGAASDDPGGSAYSFEGLDDGMPDGCEESCPWDLDGSGDVGVTDFLDMLAVWGSSPGDPADFDGDGIVGVTDFLKLLAHWGPCP
jgi:hypothetical protein